MFFFQFLVMMGLFFAIPLYLSVALGLSAIDTGLKLLPLSLTMSSPPPGYPSCSRNRPPACGQHLARRRRRRHRVALHRDGRGRDRVDRHRPCRCSGSASESRLAAGRHHGVGGHRRAEPRGRWSAEHSEPRRFARYRAGRLILIGSPHVVVHQRHPGEPRHPRRGQEPIDRGAGRWHQFVSDADWRPDWSEAGVRRTRLRQVTDENENCAARWRRPYQPSPSGPSSIALFFSGGIPSTPVGRESGREPVGQRSGHRRPRARPRRPRCAGPPPAAR